MLSGMNKEKIELSNEVRVAIFLLIIFGLYVLFFPANNQIIPEPKNDPLPKSSEEITHGDRSKMQIIFTFDGGDRATSGEKIISVLEKHQVKGTFFLTGKFVEKNPLFVKKVYDAGHEIYNHTYNHPYLTFISDDHINEELLKTDQVFKAIIGISAKPYFRPPYGDRDDRVLKQAFISGYQSVYWTVDALDWKEGEGETADTVRYRILSTLAPGNIYLMHIGDNITGEILDDLFREIRLKGYNIVSLTQGL